MPPQKKVGLFLFLTFSLSLFSYIPIIRAGTLEIQGGLFVFTLMYSPGLAAIITQFIATRGMRGLGWRLGSVRWLGIAYILPVAYTLPVYVFTWLYVNSGSSILLTTLFHAAQSFFVIVNEGLTGIQQAWLMAGVYLAVALIVVLATGSRLTRRPVARISQTVQATGTGQPLARK